MLFGNNKNERMDKSNISTLAKLLHKTGDRVLQGDKTLLLYDELLKNLNDSFKFLDEERGCDTSFLVTKTNNSNESVFQDIQFLHDFIQKVVGVCITKDVGKSVRRNVILDIKKFKSLRTLELSKIPVQNVIGIEQIRPQLQCVICVHSLQQLQDILLHCGADHSSAGAWEELSEGVFTYNALETIDNSLLYTPLLQSIDLSHNRLKNFCVEDCLPNLKILNVSFNLLQSVPSLGKDSACKLKTLILRNNYLKDLSGLSKFKNLMELDVACNSLVDHSTLFPLENLPLLSSVNLLGNPLSFHFKHRALSVSHLHLNTAISKFDLDGCALSRKERKFVRLRGEARREAWGEAWGDNPVVVPARDYSPARAPATAHTALSAPDDEDDYSSPVVQIQSKKISRSKRQRLQVKDAVIAESPKGQAKKTSNPLTESQEHLKVKRDVELLRQRFGKDWLSEQGATQLQAVLGLPQISSPSLVETLSYHAESLSSSFDHKTFSQQDGVESSIPSQQLTESQNVPSNGNPFLAEKISEKYEQPKKEEEEEEEEDQEWGEEEADQDQNIYSESEEEDLDERKLFTVRNANANSKVLLLVVGTHNLQERDVKTGRVLQKWDFETLQSCELLSDNCCGVRLAFNVMRRDRRERTYIVEPAEAKELTHLLGDVLASRSLSDMNQVAYRCMKCSTQFSREEDSRFASRGNSVLCPNCNCSIVCMMEEAPLPSRASPNQQRVPSPATYAQSSLPIGPSLSSSQSSIAGSKDCSPAAAPGSTKDCCLQVAAVVHQADAPSVSSPRPSPPLASLMASAPALTRSAVSLEENYSALTPRRYDSDIEVISNPSQSSIEVIDGGIRTPGRKCSSEEPQPALATAEENLKTVSSPAIPSLGLTESSSSGSFTDSICTTYETQRSGTNSSLSEEQPVLQHQNGTNNQSSRKNIEKHDVLIEEDGSLYGTEPVPSLQEMFEGLLEKVDKKLAKSVERKPVSSVMDSSIQYSYDDFQQVDHRLRLYFLQELLESDEELVLVVRAEILKSDSNSPFPGLAVFSSAHLWVLQIIGSEGDSPETWLQENLKMPLSSVNGVFPLPWAQGVGLRCQEPYQHILILLQDSQRTQNFLQAAASSLPEVCGVIHEPSNYHHQFLNKLQSICSNFGEQSWEPQLVSIFDSFSIKGEKEPSVKLGVVVVRTADIFVTESNLSWLFPNAYDNTAIKALAAQQISDLMEVVTNESHIALHFVDEARHKEEVWSLSFQTPMCVEAVVVAVRTPWEQLFSVPLQITEGNS